MTDNNNQAIKDEIIRVLALHKHTKRNVLRYSLPFTITDRKLRALVESLIVDDGMAIQSSEKGYSLITTLEQLNEAIEYLEAKSRAIAIRKNCLSRNYSSGKLQSQLEMFTEKY